jgi:hypothetical protein
MAGVPQRQCPALPAVPALHDPPVLQDITNMTNHNEALRRRKACDNNLVTEQELANADVRKHQVRKTELFVLLFITLF